MILSAYIYGMVTIQYPEEKIHFIEYGILAYLVFRPIHMDIQKPAAYGYAFILITIFGWIDEGIQHLLPNRYYQTEDVILNSISGGLGLLWIFIAKKEQKACGRNNNGN
jgi:VanZ family protein